MLLISCSLALLVIYAGTKLLLRSRVEMLPRFYKFMSIFIIIMGMLLVICTATAAIMQCCHNCERGTQEKHHRMMNKTHDERCPMAGHASQDFHHNQGMKGCCLHDKASTSCKWEPCGHMQYKNCCDTHMKHRMDKSPARDSMQNQ